MKNEREHVGYKGHWQEFCQAVQLGQHEILAGEDRIDVVVTRLLRLLKTGDFSNLQAILTGIHACCGQGDDHTRHHGLQIISRLLRSNQSSKLPAPLLRVVAQIFCRVVGGKSGEQQDISDTVKTYHSVVARMLSLALWGDLASFFTSLHAAGPDASGAGSQIGRSFQPYRSSESIQKVVALLVTAFGKARAVDRLRIKEILQIFGDEAVMPLIEELFQHRDKEVRIALFEVIPRRANIIVPGILKRLASKQPWYVLRNAILLLALLDDSGLFCMVKPFLKHPDHRVQKAVIDFVALVGSDDVRGDLVDAVLIVDDQLLPGLVLLLQQYGGEEVEAAFLALLSDRHQVAASVRDELVVRLCESGRLPATEKSLKILDKIITDETYNGMSGSQVHLAATQALQVIQQHSLDSGLGE